MKKIFFFLILTGVIFGQSGQKSWEDYKNLVKDSINHKANKTDLISLRNQISNDSLNLKNNYSTTTQTKNLIHDSLANEKQERIAGDNLKANKTDLTSLRNQISNDSLNLKNNYSTIEMMRDTVLHYRDSTINYYTVNDSAGISTAIQDSIFRYNLRGYVDSYNYDNEWIDFWYGGKNVDDYLDSSEISTSIDAGRFTFGTSFGIDSSYYNPRYGPSFRIKYNSGDAFPKFISASVRNNIFQFDGDFYASAKEKSNAVFGFWINRTELNGNGIIFCDVGGGQHRISYDNLSVEGYESDWFGVKYLKVLRVDGDYSYIEYYAYKYSTFTFRLSIYNTAASEVVSLTIYNPTLIYTKNINPLYIYKSLAEKNGSRFIGKKILYIGDSQYNLGEFHSILARLTGANIIDAHIGGYRMAYSATMWFYNWTIRQKVMQWTDVDVYILPISSNDNGGGTLSQSAIDSVEYFYPVYGDNPDTVAAKLARFSALSEANKDSIFGFQETYSAYLKSILENYPEARIIICSVPISCGSGSMTGDTTETGDGIWSAGHTATERRTVIEPISASKRNQTIAIKDWFGLNFCDLKNQVGLTYTNFPHYSKDGVHWDLQSGEIKKRIAYAVYQELLKLK